MEVVIVSAFFSILVAIITSFVSSTLYIRQTRADLQKEYESRFNERKWQTYTEFANIISQVVASTKNKQPTIEKKKNIDPRGRQHGTDNTGQSQNTSTENYSDQLIRVAGSLMIVGSDRVIEAYKDWLNHVNLVIQNKIQDENLVSLTKLMNIVVEMRKDLGYKSDATSRDLLALIVRDTEKSIK